MNGSRECPGQEQRSGRNRCQRAEAEEGRKNIRSQRREAAQALVAIRILKKPGSGGAHIYQHSGGKGRKISEFEASQSI